VLILQGLPVASFGETLEELLEQWEEIGASGIAPPSNVMNVQRGLPLGSFPVHPQFILDALFLRLEREKVHTIIREHRCCNRIWRQTAEAARNGEATVQTKLKDNGRIWLWVVLAVIVTSQLYFVQELLAVFALFTLGFAAIAFVVASLYMLRHYGELAVVRLAEIRRPVMNVPSVSPENQKAT
jgi:hypothetical protein